MKFHAKEKLPIPEAPKIDLPSNIILAASHASREIPTPKEGEDFQLSNAFLEYDHLKRDYSDYATGLVQDWFESKNTVSPRYGRIAGDPNRAANLGGDKGVHRAVNMGGDIKIWSEGKEPDEHTKAIWIDEHHRTYFEQIIAKVMTALKETPGNTPILFVDLHDTGDFRFKDDGGIIDPSPRLESFGKDKFFSAVISDRDGMAANPNVTQAFISSLVEVYDEEGIPTGSDEVDINGYYKGGYVTEFVGTVLPQQLIEWGMLDDANRINAIQLEIPRSRMMSDERKQLADPELAHHEAEMLGKILIKTAQKISS